MQAESARLAGAVPLFAAASNNATKALATVREREGLQCACALCAALARLQARWRGLALRRKVAPMRTHLA